MYRMNMKLIIILAVALLVGLTAGCTQRDNPLTPSEPDGSRGLVFDAVHQYNGLMGLTDTVWSVFSARHVAVYTPPGYKTTSLGFRYPVLYLLPGYDGEASFQYDGGNENYFRIASIAKVADRLIASGEIKPMLIVMPDASIWYGGAFYANSELAGRWEDMMALELVDYIEDPDTTVFRTIGSKEARAIAGHSSGGYGAIRLAMKYPELYNSVSAIDAPLSFDGARSSTGIRPHFSSYLTESGISSESDFLNTDSTGMRSQPSKLLLYSMAATYSPTVKDGTSPFGKMSILLPFDYQGNAIADVWSLWLDNDLYTWLDDGTYFANLQNQNIHLEWSDHDLMGFNSQTQAFSGKLAAAGVTHSTATFSSYGGYDAQSRSFQPDTT